ncbi:MAG: hypothetical protein N2595_09015 [bacterium]|nr:hypothetical protein [bacterium]
MSIGRLSKRRGVRAVVFGVVGIVVGWFLLPPLVADTRVVRWLIARYLGRELGAHVEVGKVSASSWRGAVVVRIGTVDVYEKGSDNFVAYCERVELWVKPWWLLVGRVVIEPVRIELVEVELPTMVVQRMLMRRGYLSGAIWEEPVAGLRRTLGLRGVVGRARSSKSGWEVELRGECGETLLRGGRFEVACVHDGERQETRIEGFTLEGERVVEKHFFDGREMRVVEVSAPVRVKVIGNVRGSEVTLSPIEVRLGGCWLTGRFTVDGQNMGMRARVGGQGLETLVLVWPGFALSSGVERIEGGVTSESELHSGRLITEGVLKVGAGVVRGVPVREASVTLEMVNDRISALNMAGEVFGGFLAMSLLESGGLTGSNRMLLGQVAVRGLDLNACLGTMERIPATAGGELYGRFSFSVTNMGIGAFLRRRVSELGELEGEGTVVLSNAYVSYFGGRQWESGAGVPRAAKQFLGLAGVLTEAVGGVALLNRLIKPGEYRGPQAIRARCVVKHGEVATPEFSAETPFGHVRAEGVCAGEGVLQYRVRCELNEEISAKFAEHPVLSQFYRDGVLVVPLSVSGTVGEPRVRLDLTEAERQELEERLLALVTEYVAGKLGQTNVARVVGEGGRVGTEIEEAVRSIMRRLF